MKFYPLASALMKIVVLTVCVFFPTCPLTCYSFCLMRKQIVTVCVFFPTCPLTAIADNALPASENTIRVSNDGDTLSAQITDADISDVARMLSKAAGIRVLLNQSITHTIRSGFQDVPIETGIKKLFGPNLNTALIFVKEKNASGGTVYLTNTVRHTFCLWI